MSLGNDNIVSEILNSNNNIKNKIELILESKDFFVNDKDLIIFCYLLGYLSCKKRNSYNKEKILNIILEFSCRNKTNETDISDIIINLCLLLSNYIKEDNIKYNNNFFLTFDNNNNGNNINSNRIIVTEKDNFVGIKDFNDKENINNIKNNTINNKSTTSKIFNIIKKSQNTIELNENNNIKDKNNNINSKDNNLLNSQNNLSNNNMINFNKKNISINNNETQINNNPNIFIHDEKNINEN